MPAEHKPCRLSVVMLKVQVAYVLLALWLLTMRFWWQHKQRLLGRQGAPADPGLAKSGRVTMKSQQRACCRTWHRSLQCACGCLYAGQRASTAWEPGGMCALQAALPHVCGATAVVAVLPDARGPFFFLPAIAST